VRTDGSTVIEGSTVRIEGSTVRIERSRLWRTRVCSCSVRFSALELFCSSFDFLFLPIVVKCTIAQRRKSSRIVCMCNDVHQLCTRPTMARTRGGKGDSRLAAAAAAAAAAPRCVVRLHW
jgi:hypothetical protein